MSSLDISAIKLGALQVSAKGAKQVPLFYNNDTSIFTKLGPLSVCYEPSAFGDPTATRVNLSLASNEPVEKALSELDTCVVQLLAADSSKFFGTTLSESQVLERMQPSIRVSEKGYKNSCRMKMNLSGRGRVQIFDMDKAPCEAPESWIGANCTARVLVKSVWLMNKEWGILYEAVAVQIETSAVECPF